MQIERKAEGKEERGIGEARGEKKEKNETEIKRWEKKDKMIKLNFYDPCGEIHPDWEINLWMSLMYKNKYAGFNVAFTVFNRLKFRG